MKRLPYVYLSVVLVVLLVAFGAQHFAADGDNTVSAHAGEHVAPQFEVDPSWPKPLPNDWILGQVAGIDVDAEDDVWLVQRPGSLTESERGLELGRSICCRPAPPVMEFDSAGNLLQAWGGPADCTPPEGENPVIGGDCYEWPSNEHGLFIDHMGNVWIAGNGGNDQQVLKFSSDGTFLLQVGRSGETGGNGSETLLGRPAEIAVDGEANELYVADGYLNNRVIVFDAETGAYQRHWGADGLPPGSEEVDQFGNPVHCVVLTNDDLVYVCDRSNSRIQVFEKDGTFVREFSIAPETLGLGSTWDIDFSPDEQQSFLYDADGENNVVWIVQRETDEVLTSFGRSGRYAGQFHWVHNLATDSMGNIYTAEVDTGKRAQKFNRVGQRPVQ